MTNDRIFSDLSLSRKECPKCGAIWINNEHYWSGTGVNKSNELDLAGLVCNKLGMINASILSRGKVGGDTGSSVSKISKSLPMKKATERPNGGTNKY